MEDPTKRFIELRSTLRTAKETTDTHRRAFELARENEGWVQQELDLAVRDCEHEWGYSVAENEKDEDGDYINGDCVIVTRICKICESREAHALDDGEFYRQTDIEYRD